MFGLILVMCVTSCIYINLLTFIEAANNTDLNDVFDKTVILNERIKYLTKAKTNAVNITLDEKTSDSFKMNLANSDMEPNRRFIVTTGNYSNVTSDIIKKNYKNTERFSEYKRSTSDTLKTSSKSYELEPNRRVIVTTGKYSDISSDINKRNYKNTERLSEYKRITPDIVERYYKRADRITINFEPTDIKTRPEEAVKHLEPREHLKHHNAKHLKHHNPTEFPSKKEQQTFKQYLGLRQHLAPKQPSLDNHRQKKHLIHLFPRELFYAATNQSHQTLKNVTPKELKPVQFPSQEHVNPKNHPVVKEHTGSKNQHIKTEYQPRQQPVPSNLLPKEPNNSKENIKKKKRPKKHMHPKYPNWETYPRPRESLKSEEYLDPKLKNPIENLKPKHLAPRGHSEQIKLGNLNDYDDPKEIPKVEQDHYVVKKELNGEAYPGPRESLESTEHLEINKVYKRLRKPRYPKNEAKKVISKGNTEDINNVNATTQFVDLMAYTVLQFIQAAKRNVSDNPKLIRLNGNQEKPSVMVRLDPHKILRVLKNALKPNNNLQRMINVLDRQDNGSKFEDNTK